jgi:hypothetical protein
MLPSPKNKRKFCHASLYKISIVGEQREARQRTKNFIYFGDRQSNMGLKIKCYWEVLWNHIEILGNILGTPWELDGNKIKIKKIPPHQNPKLFITIFNLFCVHGWFSYKELVEK